MTAQGLFCFSSMTTNIITLLSAEESDRSACLLGRSAARSALYLGRPRLCAWPGRQSVTSATVFKLTCLLPFGKNLPLLLSELVGGAVLGSTGQWQGWPLPLLSPCLTSSWDAKASTQPLAEACSLKPSKTFFFFKLLRAVCLHLLEGSTRVGIAENV